MLAGQGQRGIWRAATIGYNMKAKAGTGGDYLRAFVFTTNFRETMRSERKDKDQTAWMSLLDLQQTYGTCTVAASWSQEAQRSPPRGKGQK